MNKPKKISLVVGIIVLIVSLGFGAYVLSQQNIFQVSTGAMQPMIKPLDKIKFDPSVSFDKLKIEDIIVFYKPSEPRAVLISRIVDISIDSQEMIIITTKGDANPQSIQGTDFPITEKEYIGKFIEIIESPYST